MAKKTASERIISTLAATEQHWLPVHTIANVLMDVSACSVSARLRELARMGRVVKRRAEGKPYDEWALVKSQRDMEDYA